MKIRKGYIKIVAVIVLVIFLYSFTQERSSKKQLNKVDVKILDSENLFVTYPTVNKLLIQNEVDVTSIPKEKLVLKKLEDALNSNEMVENAEVYLSVNGQLNIEIKQRTPIARLGGKAKCYLDINGDVMPLSPIYSARVPLVTGTVSKNNLEDIYKLAMYVRNDEFLSKNVIGIQQTGNNFEMRFRVENFTIKLGDVNNLESKFNNLKAFYQKASKDKTLNNYAVVDLQFKNQVVCAKI
ncbi:cell division protein FtsQ/DivIB [Abyssalbus ytuae]|uniref:Cell division protein FtsQ n=1 Tax=Abyssalbus ytuae TaxID=2926907 RepID=A0A9E7D438_9FLAO|nr:cell division protein FtsQ/DivIB [Abyssalbus ytuae]UOB18489.1 hypothetical protein MQE35_04160 [Abyssalbus ytuae]